MANAVNLILTIILGFGIKGIHKFKSPGRKSFIILVTAFLVFVAGARGLYALGDTDSYYSTYMYSGVYSFRTFVSSLQVDYLFYISNWFFSHLGIPWQCYLMIHSAFVLGTFGYWIYDNSEDPVLSFVVFEAMFLNVWQGSLRQAMAMALLLWAYQCLKYKKKAGAALLIVAAFFCHSTSIVFLLFFVLRRIPITNIVLTIYALVCVCAFVFRSNFLAFVNVFAEALNRNMYTTFYQESSMNLILLVCIVIAIAWLIRKNYIKYYPQYQEHYCAVFLMLLMLALGSGVMVRLAWYFGIFLCLMVPVIAKSVKQKRVARILIVIILALLYLKGADLHTWYFFWQK